MTQTISALDGHVVRELEYGADGTCLSCFEQARVVRFMVGTMASAAGKHRSTCVQLCWACLSAGLAEIVTSDPEYFRRGGCW